MIVYMLKVGEWYLDNVVGRCVGWCEDIGDDEGFCMLFCFVVVEFVEWMKCIVEF